MNNLKQKAFLEAYASCHDAFVRYCTTLSGNKMDADDLIQEVLLSAYKHFDDIQQKDQLLHYLIRAARYRSISWWKKAKHFVNLSDKKCQQLASEAITPETSLDIQLLYRAMNKLPEAQRNALILFEVNGFSMKEIAEIQESSEGAVRTKIWRGRKKLRKMMTERTVWMVLFGFFFKSISAQSAQSTRMASTEFTPLFEQLRMLPLAQSKVGVIQRFNETLQVSTAQSAWFAPIFHQFVNQTVMSTVSISTLVIAVSLFFYNAPEQLDANQSSLNVSTASIGTNIFSPFQYQSSNANSSIVSTSKTDNIKITVIKDEEETLNLNFLASKQLNVLEIQQPLDPVQVSTFVADKVENNQATTPSVIFSANEEPVDTACPQLITTDIQPENGKVFMLNGDSCQVNKQVIKKMVEGQEAILKALKEDKLISKNKRKVRLFLNKNEKMKLNRKVIPDHLQQKYIDLLRDYFLDCDLDTDFSSYDTKVILIRDKNHSSSVKLLEAIEEK